MELEEGPLPCEAREHPSCQQPALMAPGWVEYTFAGSFPKHPPCIFFRRHLSARAIRQKAMLPGCRCLQMSGKKRRRGEFHPIRTSADRRREPQQFVLFRKNREAQ